MLTQAERVRSRAWRDQSEYVLNFVSWFAPVGNSLAIVTFWYFGRSYVEPLRLYIWIVAELSFTALLVYFCRKDLRYGPERSGISFGLHLAVSLVSGGFSMISWLSPNIYNTSDVKDWFMVLFILFALSCGPLAANGLLPKLAATALLALWTPTMIALIRSPFRAIPLLLAGFLGVSLMILRDSKKRLDELIDLRSESDLRAAQLWRQAQSDDLTGLGNRFSLTKVLNARDPGNYAFVLVDLDNFKQVNDIHGHTVGDAVLIEVASGLQSSAGGAMIVARMGGDEFVVLVELGAARITVGPQDPWSASPQDLAYAFGENLRAAIERGSLVARHGVSASVGISLIDENISAQSAFERADHALYIGKRAGRAMTVVFDPEIHIASRSSRKI